MPLTGLRLQNWLKTTSCCKQILDFSHVCNAFADFLTVPWHCNRYTSDNEAEKVPLLSGKLLALCDYMHIRALFSDKAQMDKVLVNICPSLFMFLKRLFLQVLPAHELHTILQKRIQWHNANISTFVKMWLDGGSPSGLPGYHSAGIGRGILRLPSRSMY